MKHSVVMADVTKNRLESPRSPTVPGPAASAKTFTKEKQPLMTPNPKPETGNNFRIKKRVIKLTEQYS